MFGLIFLYVPILSMIVFSFNNSRLVTVWDAAHSPTLKWYGELLSNGQILDAAWLSIRIALVAATGAVILGTLTGVALARFGPFRGRTLLSGMTTAPIVMPEVITGLSLLLMFVALEQLIGWPKGSGALTITLSHITFCMAYVTVVVQSRLVGFDESLEEAAMDLGRAACHGVLSCDVAADRAGDSFRLAAGVHVVVGRSGHHSVRRGTRIEYLADGHFLESAPRRESGCERSRHDHGAAGHDRHHRFRGVDALPEQASRAR